MNKNNRIMGGGFLRRLRNSSFGFACSLAAGCALAYLALTLACDRGGPEQARPEQTLPPEPPRDEFPAAWEASRSATSIQSVQSESNRLLVSLHIPQTAAMGRQRGAFNLTLPEMTAVQSRVVRYAIGGRVLWDLAAGEDAATTSPLATGEARPADVIAKGYLRQYPIYRLTVMDTLLEPFRDLPVAERGDVSVVLELSWSASGPDGDAPAAPPDEAKAEDPPLRGMRAVAAGLVANPGDLERFASANPGGIHEGAPRPRDPRKLAPGGKAWARVRISQDGLYRLDGRTLTDAGVLAPGEPLDNLRIFSEGMPVGILRLSGQAGDSGGGGTADSAFFHGWGGTGSYSAERIYWVTADGGVPRTNIDPIDPTLTDRNALPLERIQRHFRLENDAHMLVEHGNFLSFKGAYWVDRKMLEETPVMLPVRLFEPMPWADGQTLPLRLKFHVYGNPRKWTGTELTLSVGSTMVATFNFDSPDAELLRTVALPVELLHGGRFNIRLDVIKKTPSTADAEDNAGIWLDWVEMDYPGKIALENGLLAIDADAVTSAGLFRLDGLSTQAVSPGASLVSLAVNRQGRETRLLEPAGQASLALADRGWMTGIFDLAALEPVALEPVTWDDSALDWSTPADYLIITHEAFREGLAPLLELNEARGLKTRVVDIGDLYNFFSDGALSPQAIRDYLAYTAAEAGPDAPDYVLLAGDCTSDFLDETRSGVINWVPTYSYRSGEDTFASDIWFAMAVGADALPDYLLGRISVNNQADLASVLGKTVDYANAPVFGPWRARMASVADNFEQFRRTAESIESRETPRPFENRQVFLDRMSLEDNWYYPQDELERIWAEERTMMKVSGESTLAIKDTFDKGAAWLDFYGHGAPNLWTDERIWFGGDSPNRDSQHLEPNGLYAFICNFTCNTGAIDYPMPQWNICISEDMMRIKGAGAVGMFVPSGPGQTILHEKLSSHLRRALFRDHLRGFGEVTTMARLRYLLDDNAQSLVWMYNLLGDPVTNVALPRRWGELSLDRDVVMPGRDMLAVSADGIWPPEGSAVAWVEDGSGNVVWKNDELACRDGGIRFQCLLPGDFPTPLNARIYLYVWNEQAGRDFVATAAVRTARPEVMIRQARVARSPEDAALVHFELDLENTGLVDADPVALRLTRQDDPDRPLNERSVSLQSGQTRTEALDLRIEANPEFVLLDWALSLPEDPDSTLVANPQHIALVLAGQSQRTGIVRELSYWEPASAQTPNGRVHVECLSADGNTTDGLYLQWRTAAGDAASSVPLTFEKTGGGAMKSMATFTPPSFRQHQAGDNLLELVGVDPDAGTTRTIDQVRLTELAQREPRLRIRPGSIWHEPEYPTDGQTIYVNFIVENLGLAASAPTTALLQSDDSENGQGVDLPVQTSLQDNRVPGLAPGRSVPVRLRWDPVKNAGVQNIRVNLNPRPDRPEDTLKEQLLVHRIYVKTKSNLVRTRPPWSSASEEDRLADRIWLHVEVENKGETDARNVLVSFYLDQDRTDEKLIGRVEVDTIPARQRREVKLMWSYDREKVLRDGKFNVRPVVDIRLKGSSQRIAE